MADLLIRVGDTLRITNLLCTIPARFMAEMPGGGRCLCTHAMNEFNTLCPDAPGVRYLSVGGDRGAPWRTSPELLASHLYISSLEGPNDGMVSVQSSRWGKYLMTLDLDHLHQINFPLAHRWLSGAPSYNEVLDAYKLLAAI